MKAARLALLGLAALVGCESSEPVTVQSAEASGPAPRVSVVVRGSIVPGRPVPLRITLSNDTPAVIIPVSASFETGKGEARWGRAILGEVVYDAESDRFLENPVAQRSSPNLIYRSALMPGERLVEDLEVRYQTIGPTKDQARVVFHRLSASEFEQRVYVGIGGMMPRRFQPVGLLPEGPARTGALLAGFFLRSDRPTETAVADVAFEIPALPSVIAKKISAAGLSPERAISAQWAGGWAAGDEERSVVITPAGATKMLPGVPYSALQVIDDSVANVSFCVTGASRAEIEPLFAGYEIVPHKCLHVSVPRELIMATLERISARGFEIKPNAFQLREALDVVKPAGGEPAPAGAPSPTPTPAPSPKASPHSSSSSSPKPTPARTASPRPSPSPQRSAAQPAPSPAATPAAPEEIPLE